MPSDWLSTTLGEVASLRSGGTPSKSDARNWGGDLPWVTAKDMKVLRLHDTEDHLTPAGTTNSQVVDPETPLILVRGMTLHSSIPIVIPQRRVAFNQDVKAIVPRETIERSFLGYWLLAHRAVLLAAVDSASHGTGRLNSAQLISLPMRLPPRPEQRAIAGVFGALDDKIELNQRMNETLAALAITHFDQLYWHSPDRPSWNREPLAEHLDVVRGLSYTGDGLTEAGTPLHNLNSIYEGGGYKRDGLKRYSGDFKERHVARAGDVIVANTDLTWNYTVIASPAIVPRRFGNSGLFSHHLYRVRPRPSSSLTSRLIFLLLLKGPLRTEVAGYANGTTVNMLPIDALQKPLVRVPPPEVVAQIDGLVAPVFARAQAAEDESETLANLRDVLLPKLISGELRVRDAEAAAEAAGT